MVMLTLGLNYRTAPIHIREQLTFDKMGTVQALHSIVDGKKIREAVILPTCNRTEIYFTGELSENFALEPSSSWGSLASNINIYQKSIWQKLNKNLSSTDLTPYTYTYFGLDAARHLMRVVSGLDSMVLGEVEIVGQVKHAYSLANQLGVVGKYLARLFETSFNVAKTVRSTTEISAHPISISYAAVKLASHIFSNLTESSVLLIGAGELIQLTAKYLKECGVKKIWISNRTQSRAEYLANLVGGELVPFDEIPKKLFAADIVITGVYSPLPILGKGMIEKAIKLRKHKPMYMVDLGLPRNVEPEVAQLEDVFLYTLDNLQNVVADNRRMRQNAALSAEKIIEREAERFMEWITAQDSFRTIYAFRHKCEELRDQVMKEGLQRLKNGEAAERVIQRVLYSLTNRFMHLPTRRLREAGFEEERQLLDLTRDLFELHYESIDTE